MLRDNKELTVGMYFDQGSVDLKNNAEIVFSKNFKNVIDLYSVLSNLGWSRRFIWLLFFPVSFMYFFKFIRLADPKVKRLFWDGMRQDHRLFGVHLGGLVKTTYFVVRQLAKLARFIFLTFENKLDVIAFPDEVYGGTLLSFYCYDRKYYVITNFTDYRYSFSINTYNSGSSYRYSNRYTVPYSLEGNDEQERMGQQYIDEVFGGIVSHKDYAKAYSGKPHFKLDKFLECCDTRAKVLVALHNVTDAPSALDMEFETFDEWYYRIRDELRDEKCSVFVKDHPTAFSLEHTKFVKEVKNSLPNNFVFIERDFQIDLRDFDIILSCDGSIFYEAAVKNVAGISFAAGNAQALSAVVSYNSNSPLLQQIFQQCNATVDVVHDRAIIYHWHVRHDLKRFNWHRMVNIPMLSQLKDNASYRAVYSLEKNEVIFEECVG